MEKHYNKNKETLFNRLKLCEQLDSQNNELEKQVEFYRLSFQRESIKNKKLNESYDELCVKCVELQDELDLVKNELKNLKNFKTTNIRNSSPRRRRIKRCLSEGSFNYSASNNKNSQFKSLTEIFQKWSQIFDSYSRQKLLNYKDDILHLNAQNDELNDKLIKLEAYVVNLENKNRLLNVDIDELKCSLNEKDRKVEFYERLAVQQGLDANNNNLIKLTTNLERSVSPILRNSSARLARITHEDDFMNNSMDSIDDQQRFNFDHVSLYNECSEYFIKEELFKSPIHKADSQIQCNLPQDLSDNDDELGKDDPYSNYKNIFKQIYDTINSSKIAMV